MGEEECGEMRGKSNKDYIGRYTISEFRQAKFYMSGEFNGELSSHAVDKILSYCAKHDWPAERPATYAYAKTQGQKIVDTLRNYDRAQEILDAVHHGNDFKRVWGDD